MQSKIFRVAALSLTCFMSLASLPSQAQGLRLPGGAEAAGSALFRGATQAPASGVRQADYIVAVVNSEPITNNDVRARLKAVAGQFEGRPNAPSVDLLAREVLEQLILERAQIQEAQQMGLSIDDFTVERAEQSVAMQNSVTQTELHRRLAQDGISVSTFRSNLRNQMLLQRVRERAVDGKINVTEGDVDNYLRGSQANATGPESFNLGHILLAVPERASSDEQQRLQAQAQQLADRARGGEDFAALARSHSGAGQQGEGMGLRPADRYPELFVQAVQTVPVGGIAGPLRSGAGFHILKVLQREKSLGGLIQQSHARHILLRTGPQLSEREAVQRLTELRRRIQGGHLSFSLAAQEHSQDGSASQGGDLGWAGPGRYVPEFEEAMNALQPGEVSEPLISRFGVHLIELIERRQAQPTVREMRDMAREAVRERKREEEYNRWAEDLRGRAYVEYRDPPH